MMKLRFAVLLVALAALAGYSFLALTGPRSSDIRLAQAAETGAGPAFDLDDRELDRSNAARITSYADVLKRATPSVVGVSTARIVRYRPNQRVNPMEEFLRRYYGLPPRQQPDGSSPPREQRQDAGVGSGVIISEDGYILTNNHVVRDRDGSLVDEILINLQDGREFQAEVVGTDPQTDIAVIKIEAEASLPAITMADSDRIRVGDVVFAIGNPLNVGITVTQGIISALGRTDLGILGFDGYENFIQTDASINLGNSGGALVDAQGRLIGINTAILSRTGGNIGIGFAIPSNLARSIVTSLIEDGVVERGFLGVQITELTPELATSFGLDTYQGVLISRVTEDSPAARAGLRHGDVITRVAGRPVTSPAELRLAISQRRPGTAVDLTIRRGTETLNLEATLGSLPGTEMAARPTPEADTPLKGVSLAPLDGELRERFEVPEDVDGVVVTDLAADSPWIDTFSPGLVIIEVNRQTVKTVSDVEAALRIGDPPNSIYGWFQGNFGFTTFRLDP
ncbi:MAG: DegQ family serine endoprotease [Opitutales bacterium]